MKNSQMICILYYKNVITKSYFISYDIDFAIQKMKHLF
jgi:hypothetical protein